MRNFLHNPPKNLLNGPESRIILLRAINIYFVRHISIFIYRFNLQTNKILPLVRLTFKCLSRLFILLDQSDCLNFQNIRFCLFILLLPFFILLTKADLPASQKQLYFTLPPLLLTTILPLSVVLFSSHSSIRHYTSLPFSPRLFLLHHAQAQATSQVHRHSLSQSELQQ